MKNQTKVNTEQKRVTGYGIGYSNLYNNIDHQDIF